MPLAGNIGMARSEAGTVLPFDRFAIEKELERVLSSSAFQGSKRCRDFLSFVVERTIEGRADDVKERVIAVEVFRRNPDFDLDHNSIVRVAAREVRKRLLQYYAGEGARAGIRMELPTGSYIPVFHEPPPVLAGGEAGPGRRIARTLMVTPMVTPMVTLPICVLMIAAVAAGLFLRSPPAPFEAFWQPLLDQKNAALIVMANPIVYRPSAAPGRPGKPDGPQSYVPVPEKYVGFGDSAAAFRLAELMGRHGHDAMMRLAGQVQFADLCDSGAVLIGAYTNRWTVQLMNGLRYRFVVSGGRPAVLDSRGGTYWALSQETDDESSGEDYMIISRVLQNSTGQFLVAGAGLTQYGTEEAGRILTTPQVLTGILAKLPAGWRNRNLQVVLHSEMMGDAPARPLVVAWFTW
jgi:hypothetical protein